MFKNVNCYIIEHIINEALDSIIRTHNHAMD